MKNSEVLELPSSSQLNKIKNKLKPLNLMLLLLLQSTGLLKEPLPPLPIKVIADLVGLSLLLPVLKVSDKLLLEYYNPYLNNNLLLVYLLLSL
jgi:hypothetical protein